MLLNKKQAKSAEEYLKQTIAMDKDENGIFISFATCETRKGLGEQKFYMSEIESILDVLRFACKEDTEITEKGIKPTQAEIVKQSIKITEDGSITMKTEPQQGKRPTLFENKEDMKGFVKVLTENLDELKKHAKEMK